MVQTTAESSPASVPATARAFASFRSQRDDGGLVLPPGYSDPEAYLLDSRFHKSLRYRPSWLADDTPDLRATYAVAGASDPEAPVMVWINGLGGHRLAGAFLDGLAEEMSIRVITLDRPGAGGSTPVPLSHRVVSSHSALLSVLAREQISTFSIMSHSNGVFYALYTALNLPSSLTLLSWHLSSPFVPPWLSGSMTLGLARYLPAQATASLGSIVSGFIQAQGWSSGTLGALTGASGALRGFLSASSTTANDAAAVPSLQTGTPHSTPLSEREKQERKYVNFARRQRDKDPEDVVFGGRFYTSEAVEIANSWIVAEGLDGFGEEALISLRKGEGVRWGWEDQVGQEEEGLYERGFELLKTRELDLEMHVVYGSDDFLIPTQGQDVLKRLLVDKLGLVQPNRWVVVPGAGHDDTLARDCVMVPLFRKVAQAAEEWHRHRRQS